MRAFILFFLMSGALLMVSPAAHSQKLIATDQIDIGSFQVKSSSFSGAAARYVAIKDGHSLILLHYDSSFVLLRHTRYDMGDVLNHNMVIGAAQTGAAVTFLLSDKRQRHFSTLIYQADGTFRYGVNFDMDDHQYLNWISQDDYLGVLAVKKKSSILSLLILDSSGIRTKHVFDLGKEKFEMIRATPQQDVTQSATLYDVFEDNVPMRIDPGTYQSDLTAPLLRKMYYNKAELDLSFSLGPTRTEVVRLDLKGGSYRVSHVPYAKGQDQPGDRVDGNSFLFSHYLATVLRYAYNVNVGIYDLDQGRYLGEWCSCAPSWDSLVCSSLLVENIIKGDTAPAMTREKFLKRVFQAAKLSIAANETADGNIELHIGGLEYKSSGGGGPVMMGGGGLGGLPPAPVVLGSFDFSVVEGESTLLRHDYFSGTIDLKTLTKRPAGKSTEQYDRFIRDYYYRIHAEDYQDHRGSICQFNFGDRYYIGYFDSDKQLFNIYKY